MKAMDFLTNTFNPLGERQVYARITDATLDRDGDIIEPSGCMHSNFDLNPVVLAEHDKVKLIGKATIEVKPDSVFAIIEFAPSALGDHYCMMAKKGFINAISIGYRTYKSEKLNGTRWRVLSWDLTEISLVSIPCNPNALIVRR